MSSRTIPRRRCGAVMLIAALASVLVARTAGAQGFISPTFGYNFGGDSGCPSATNCDNKNWNLGVSLGSFGALLGSEVELTYEDKFFGDAAAESTKVLTVMGNLMVAPKIALVRPYGLAGVGLIRTSVEPAAGGASTSDNQFGWTVGAGLVVYVNSHLGLKGDIRHYHSFQDLKLLGFGLSNDNKLDFGRAAFGVVLGF
jgi:opacity protein-like surface antigen